MHVPCCIDWLTMTPPPPPPPPTHTHTYLHRSPQHNHTHTHTHTHTHRFTPSQITPTSSEWLQSCTPHPLLGQSQRYDSVPVQSTLSSQICCSERPDPKYPGDVTLACVTIKSTSHLADLTRSAYYRTLNYTACIISAYRSVNLAG